MRPMTMGRLALAGSRVDTLRVTLTSVGAALGTLALLAAATVLSIRDDQPGGTYRYTNNLLNESGLRPGVSLALLLLTIPVLVFAAQCARVGAPARDRRLAALRMAGATPWQVRLVAAVETGVAALLGTVLGLATYFGGRWLLDEPTLDGRRPLPTDVLPPTWLFVAVGIGLPIVATLLAVWLLRRVVVTPFGVMRQERSRPPGIGPAIVLGVGLAGFGGVAPLWAWLAENTTLGDSTVLDTLLKVWLFVSTGAVVLGVVLTVAWLGHRAGLLLARRTGSPRLLIAARRLAADPWSGSRTLAVILVAVVFGVGAAMIRSQMAAYFRAEDLMHRKLAEISGHPVIGRDTDFYFRAFELVNYAVTTAAVIAAAGLAMVVAEGIVTRRRTLASLVAAGTPRSVLVCATLLQVVIPLVPGVLLATGSGWLAATLFVGETTLKSSSTRCEPAPGDPPSACDDPDYFATHGVPGPEVVVSVDAQVPWWDFVVVGGGAIAVVLLCTAISLLFLRSSTDVTELRTE